MHNDSYYINKALIEANKAASLDEVPVGAVIVCNNKIIAKGFNQKESTRLATNHAEIIAIKKASKKLKTWHLDDCTLYVTLEPCMMCVGAIIQSRIKRVVYGAKSKQDGSIESSFVLSNIKGLNHYPETFFYSSNENCSKILSDYFKRKR